MDGPPCGTASKARERPLKHLEQLGLKVPKPLRSRDQPDQLDGLEVLTKSKQKLRTFCMVQCVTL